MFLCVDGNGTVAYSATFDAWGNRTEKSNQLGFDFDRGYTGHEHLDPIGLINMDGRVYDPVLARFLSPDPFVQAPGNSQNFNRYSYCLNNPLKYTDPSGEFFFIFPTIGWSASGGFSIGISAILGIPGLASVSGSIGYDFGAGSLNASVGATMNFNTAYASFSTGSGFSVGYSFGLSPQIGFPISTNFSSVGYNYNITHNTVSENWSAWDIDESGVTFDPSFSVMIAPEHFTNLVRGQGFRSNEGVFENLRAQGKYQNILDYFGFKGTYISGAHMEDSGFTDTKTGEITYNENAFNKNFGKLVFVAGHEMKHRQDVLSGKYNGIEITDEIKARSEWSTYLYNYKNQGLYGNGGYNIIDRINSYGLLAGIYEYFITPKGGGTTSFPIQWWHFIYKIPRLW